jgi:hypothetical protein
MITVLDLEQHHGLRRLVHGVGHIETVGRIIDDHPTRVVVPTYTVVRIGGYAG